MTKPFRTRHAILTLLVIAIGATAGCGFHLRGKTNLAPSLAQIAVVGQDDGLVAAVEEALSFSGVEVRNVLRDGDADVATLKLTREFYERRVRTVDSRGLATSYYLYYDVDFLLNDRAGEKMLERENLRQRRDFNFDSTQVLQKDNEEQFLREDMQRDIAQAILRILGTVSAAIDRAPDQPLTASLAPPPATR